MTHTPDLIHVGSQPYRFDRIDANSVSWFRELYGPNEIPSAPRSTSYGADWGSGTGTPFQWVPEEPAGAATPEGSTLACVVLGLAYFGIRRLWR